MNRLACHFCLPLISTLIIPLMGYAEDNLLWKTVNNTPAQVVPTYGGQGSPFPLTVAPATDPSVSAVLDEKARMREEAYSYAQGLLKGGSALQPEVRSLNVGGILVGALGPRVLINNQWLGQGDKVNVRQVKTSEAVNAIKALAEYDSNAAAELGADLNANLAARPIVGLTLQSVTSTSVVLTGPQGRTVLPVGQPR
jgi:hypothetical protein